jgi:hypothetical protein
LLESYRINSCLIFRNSPLATLLAATPNWKRAYEDKLSVIFIRVGTGLGAGSNTIAPTVQSAAARKERVNSRP